MPQLRTYHLRADMWCQIALLQVLIRFLVKPNAHS